MNKKRGLICLLALVFLLQIATPVGFVAYHKGIDKKALENGTDYKFAVQIETISGGIINYSLTNGWDGYLYDIMYLHGDRREAISYTGILTDENGYASLSEPTNHHDNTPYIKLNYNDCESFPLNRSLHTESQLYYMSSIPAESRFIVDMSEEDFERNQVVRTKFYLLVRIYKGKPFTVGMFTEDGRPVEEWLKDNEAALQEIQDAHDKKLEAHYEQQRKNQESNYSDARGAQ